MTSIDHMATAAREACPVYAPLSIGAIVRLPLAGRVNATVVDIDGEHGAVVCAWRHKSSYFESWFLVAHLQRVG